MGRLKWTSTKTTDLGFAIAFSIIWLLITLTAIANTPNNAWWANTVYIALPALLFVADTFEAVSIIRSRKDAKHADR